MRTPNWDVNLKIESLLIFGQFSQNGNSLCTQYYNTYISVEKINYLSRWKCIRHRSFIFVSGRSVKTISRKFPLLSPQQHGDTQGWQHFSRSSSPCPQRSWLGMRVEPERSIFTRKHLMLSSGWLATSWTPPRACFALSSAEIAPWVDVAGTVQ